MFFLIYLLYLCCYFFLTANLDSSFSFQLSVWTVDDLCVSTHFQLTRLTRHHQPIAESTRNFLVFSTVASLKRSFLVFFYFIFLFIYFFSSTLTLLRPHCFLMVSPELPLAPPTARL